jgi:hypothetical protein
MQRLAEAFRTSLSRNDPAVFHRMLQQILRQASSWGSDLFAWQDAISILRDNLSGLLETSATSSNRLQAEEMLHQARSMISEILHGQYAAPGKPGSMADRMGQISTIFSPLKMKKKSYKSGQKACPLLASSMELSYIMNLKGKIQ